MLARTGFLRPKRRKAPTAVERRHLDRVAAMPCLVCGQPSQVHHVTASIHGGRLTRTHERVAPLCPGHHTIQFGDRGSVEALGHAGFRATYGIDLLAAADVLWAQSQEMEARRA